MIKFNVTNRFTGAVQFTAEIDCTESTSIRIKMGLALKWALESDAVLRDANLPGAVLSGAVLSGADLRDAVLSGADLSGADLSDAVLRGADLRGAVLSDADLSGADLSGADLSDAVLRGAVLSGAVLSGAVLSGAEVPIIEKIDTQILAAIEAGGTLKMNAWHTCETTHCRAGWAITLAGEAGLALEKSVGASAAGALIYAKRAPTQPIPNFYASDEAAMADIRVRAAKEAEE